MKRIKWLFGLCLMMLVVCGSGVHASNIGASSEDEINGTDTSKFHWSENEDGTLTITKYLSNEETVVIPSEIGGKLVKNIDLNHINDDSGENETTKYLTISEGVVNIMSNSFRAWSKLESVSLPNTLQTIDEYAFSDCKNLKEINFPESLTNIRRFAFSDCHSIIKLVIPKNSKVIELGTFSNCINLKEIEIKNGVEKIDGYSFARCSKLEKVIIPNSVKNIGNSAFISEPGTEFILPKSLVIYANSNSYARTYANQIGIKFNCLNAHDWDNGTITTQPTAIKDGVKTYTCNACKLTKTEKVSKLGLPQKGKPVTDPISNSNYKITKSTAQNGTVEYTKVSRAVSNITIPDTVTVDGVVYKVTSVSKNAFKNNKKLKKVTIGKNITKINANAFYGCKNLKTITIKSTQIKSIAKNVFRGINPKAKIKVPKSKLAKYKKLFKGKGQKKTVKIIK